ncbi:MAG: PAS domain-containing protein [Nitrospirae bacterium]|nr:PAS domain-containing protein [Nitrospirota bacterium]
MGFISHWHFSFDALSDPVLLLDKNNTVMRTNPAYTRTFNISPGDAIDKKSFSIAGPFFDESVKSEQGRTKEVFEPESGLYLEIMSLPVLDNVGEQEGTLIFIRNVTDLKRYEQEREALYFDLREALAKVRQLSGMLPICRSCKKIRDDKSYWNQIESYLLGRSEPELGHGVCPECLEKIYPEYHEEKCWEHLKCGQEIDKTCPVVLLEAGRSCWSVSRTLCGGQRQEESSTKLPLCMKCDFFIKLNRGEI